MFASVPCPDWTDQPPPDPQSDSEGQTEHVISKVNQRLGLLRRIKHLLPFTARLLFYNSLVLPIFDYADLVWGDKNNVELMNDLQVLQNL